MGAPVINVVPDVPQTAPATTCPSSYTKTEFLHCTLVQLYLRPTSVYSYPAYARPRPQIATTIAKPRGVAPTLKSVFCTLPCKDKSCPFPVNESPFIPEYTVVRTLFHLKHVKPVGGLPFSHCVVTFLCVPGLRLSVCLPTLAMATEIGSQDLREPGRVQK